MNKPVHRLCDIHHAPSTDRRWRARCRILLQTLLLTTLCSDAFGQRADAGRAETDDERSPWSFFPIIGFSPETSAMVGAGVVYTFEAEDVAPHAKEAHEASRRSALAVVAAYTLNAQFIASLAPSIYLDAEAWHAQGELYGKFFPNTFYPIGNDSSANSAEDYTELGVGVAGGLTRRLVGSFRSGAQAGVFHSRISDTEAGGELDRDRVAGSDGALLVGFGPVLEWDNRDNDFASLRGGRYSLSAAYFGESWGSDFNAAKYELNLRHFFPLGGQHVIGAEFYAVANLGNPPFQIMGALGGSNRMRGYFEGRFRDLHMLTAQAEYRLPLFWRFGAAVFASAGDVAHEIFGYQVADLKYAGGGGLRFSLNEADRVNLRVDAAGTSTGDANLYVTLGEAF
jgi:hypothetical protein